MEKKKFRFFKYNNISKTIVFITCVVSILLTLVSAIGVGVSVYYNVYMQDKDDCINSAYSDLANGYFTYEDSMRRKLEVYLMYSENELTNDLSNNNIEIIISSDELLYESTNSVKGLCFIDENEYDYYDETTNEYITYYVQMYVDEEFTYLDNYKIVNILLSNIYDLQYMIVLLFILFIIIDIASYLWLLNAAGRVEESKDYKSNMFVRIPFDVFSGIVFILIIILALIYADIQFLPFSCLMLPLLLIIGILISMNLAVRIKTKTLFTNTIVYLFYSKVMIPFFTTMKEVWNYNASLYVKCIILYIVVGIFAIIPYVGAVVYLLLFIPLIYLTMMLTRLYEGSKQLSNGNLDYKIDTKYMLTNFRMSGEHLNSIAEGLNIAVEERMKSERFKTELITNVSHDIKTPLTSILNYADLIHKEETSNEKIIEYSEILLNHANRLKRMSEDLIEASKVSTGNVEVDLQPCQVDVLLPQVYAEYDDKMQEKMLEFIMNYEDELPQIKVDGKYLWRVLDNVMNNIYKYAMEHTRVYIDVYEEDEKVYMIFKNISKHPLNMNSEELLGRFVRGDEARHSEGSGLGLSIANGLVNIQNGTLDIQIDGDLFKIIISFDAIK